MCDSYLNEQIVCPYCGNVEALDGYDTLGASEDCVFCNHCNLEFDVADAAAEEPE